MTYNYYFLRNKRYKMISENKKAASEGQFLPSARGTGAAVSPGSRSAHVVPFLRHSHCTHALLSTL